MDQNDVIPFVIDQQTFKIMRYIYRKHEVRLELIGRKFGDDGIVSALYLCPAHYAAYRNNETKQLTFDISDTSYKGSIGLTPLGNKYLEDRREAFVKWFVPLVTSSISVAVSLIALATSIFLN